MPTNFFFLFYYTDPGSGMLLMQLLAAGFFGALFYLRKFKDRIFKRKPDLTAEDVEDPSEIKK